MKYEWRKKDKEVYLPPTKPTIFADTEKLYITVDGKGNPNGPEFEKDVQILYALSYTIRMMPKKGIIPEGYYEYTVFPLEGIWDLDEEGRKLDYLDKDHLVYKIMIRQPDFVTEEVFAKAVELTKEKKKDLAIDKARLETIADGLTVQMMHIGSYDDEPESFAIMEKFCEENGLRRIDKRHREIYISDPRRVSPEKLKTVLRFKVEKIEE